MRIFALIFLTVILVVSAPHASYARRARHPVSHPVSQSIPVLPPLYTTFDVYVGGLNLVSAEVWFEEEGNTYHAIAKARTRGIWGDIIPWNTILDARGRINGETLEPKEFYTRDDWGHKPKITMLHFDGKGGVTPEFNPPNTDKNREIVTDEQKRNSLDPITALLQMLAHVAVDKSCAIPVAVFDGKRRFDIVGKDAGESMTDGDDYGVFSGEARLCDASFKMISGEWKDREHAHFWQKTETESGRDPFHIWLAKPAPGLPEMPVRLETDSIAGLVVIHLSSWRYASRDEIKAQTP